jgi:hypothetical protein
MITFEIGKKEKHTISFNYETMWGKLNILVDGKEQTTTRKMVIGETPFQFQVGNEEKHDVRIVLNNPLGFAFRGSSMKAYVDDKLVREEHIGSSLFALIMFILSFVFLIFIFGYFL